MTIISPRHGTGVPIPRAATRGGAANQRAEDKNRNVDYPDVEASPLAQLLALGCETYGRWSKHSLTLVRHLCKYKSRNFPGYLQKAVEQASFARWWNLPSINVQKIVADSILRDRGSDLFEAGTSLVQVPLEDLLDLIR